MSRRDGVVLLADIGGTNARFALWRDQQLGRIYRTETEALRLLPALIDALELPGHIDRAIFSVAGPVAGGRVTLTNAGITLDAKELGTAFGAPARLLNDFEALAHGLVSLPGEAVATVNQGEAVLGAPRIVIGPGTGLGLAAWIPSENADGALAGDGRALTTEGGHVSLAARTEEEHRIVAALAGRYGHVSAERAVSGPGLSALYAVLGGTEREPADISRAALDGEAMARSAVGHLLDFLATVAGDAALTLGARGGVYLAGGVLTALNGLFDTNRFHARFTDKGRFGSYLERVPVYRLIAPDPAFFGLAALARRD